MDFPVTAQDEAVYSHAAIAMDESGDWSTPTFMGRFFLYKPPLLYWLSGLSIKLFGVSAWALRLPSILAAAFTAGLVFVWVLGAANRWRATLAVVFLVTCPLFRELGRRNMTDALIMFVIVATAWLLARGKPLEALAACILGPQPEPDPAELASIKNPVLVVVGGQDDIVAEVDRLIESIPTAKLVKNP